MRSTGLILASDWPFSGSDPQGIAKKQHPVLRKRNIRARIGNPGGISAPKISTCSNATGRDLQKIPAPLRWPGQEIVDFPDHPGSAGDRTGTVRPIMKREQMGQGATLLPSILEKGLLLLRGFFHRNFLLPRHSLRRLHLARHALLQLLVNDAVRIREHRRVRDHAGQ